MTPTTNFTTTRKARFTRIEDLTRREFMSSALGAALLIACGGDEDESGPTATGSASTRRVRHALGQSEVPVAPQRMVTLWRPTLAAAVLLGFQPIGSIGNESADGFGLVPYLPEAFPLDELQLVGPSQEFDLEEIAALQPDLIVGAHTESGPETELYPQLSQIAPTVALKWDGTVSWRSHLVDLADALGVPEKAQAVVQDYEEQVEAVRSAIGVDPSSLQVSLVRVQGADELRLETPRSFPGQVIEDIGFTRPEVQLTPDEGRDFIEISLERIRDAEGDKIFVFHNAANAAAWQQISENPLWQDLQAAQAGKVFVFEYEWWGASNYYGAFRILSDVQSAVTA